MNQFWASNEKKKNELTKGTVKNFGLIHIRIEHYNAVVEFLWSNAESDEEKDSRSKI